MIIIQFLVTNKERKLCDLENILECSINWLDLTISVSLTNQKEITWARVMQRFPSEPLQWIWHMGSCTSEE